MGYTKLFSEIITSSIWQEPNDSKVMWITILALKGRDQICRATIPALAKYSDTTLERCEEIMEKFQSPDKYSNSQEYEGRRIRRVDGGWLVLNGEKYRDKMNPEEVREYNRVKKQEERARKKVKFDPKGLTAPHPAEINHRNGIDRRVD